jgi:hypothetical protein
MMRRLFSSRLPRYFPPSVISDPKGPHTTTFVFDEHLKITEDGGK